MEEEHVLVGGGDEEVFDEVFVFGLHGNDTFTTTPLRSEKIYGQPLDIACIGNCYCTYFPLDEIFQIDFFTGAHDISAAFITIFIANFDQFIFNDTKPEISTGKQAF